MRCIAGASVADFSPSLLFHRRNLVAVGQRLLMTSSILRSHTREFDVCDEGIISVEEWRKWGPVSPFPSAVKQIVDDLKVLECKLDSPIDFGGNGGKLQVNADDYHDNETSLLVSFQSFYAWIV